MKISLIALAGLMLAIAGTAATAGQTVPAKADDAKKLVGTWRLVSRNDTLADGRSFVEPSLDAAPLGYLMYDATGHVAVQLMRRNRTAADTQASSPSSQPSIAVPAALNGYEAYFGTYTVEETAHTVTHHVEGAMVLANVGKYLVRNYSFQGAHDDRLALSLPLVESDGTKATRTLVWERVK